MNLSQTINKVVSIARLSAAVKVGKQKRDLRLSLSLVDCLGIEPSQQLQRIYSPPPVHRGIAVHLLVSNAGFEPALCLFPKQVPYQTRRIGVLFDYLWLRALGIEPVLKLMRQKSWLPELVTIQRHTD